MISFIRYTFQKYTKEYLRYAIRHAQRRAVPRRSSASAGLATMASRRAAVSQLQRHYCHQHACHISGAATPARVGRQNYRHKPPHDD